MTGYYNINGITVKELKAVLKEWPENNIYGEDCEVWVLTGGCLSSPVKQIIPLNKRMSKDEVTADILLTPEEE